MALPVTCPADRNRLHTEAAQWPTEVLKGVPAAGTDGTSDSYVHCEDVLGTGYGYKKDDDSDRGPRHGRKDPMHDEEVTAAEMFEQALTDGSPWGGWARPAGGPGAGGEAPPDMQPSSIELLQVRTRPGKESAVVYHYCSARWLVDV